MIANNYELLNYGKWNRRLMNLYWAFILIGFVTEILILIKLSEDNFLGYTPTQYVINFIIIPTVLMISLNTLCEGVVFFTKKRYANIQPYAITFTCVLLSTVLLSIHYGITVLCAAYILPVFFSLVYDSKRVLLATFIFSASTFTCTYVFYLSRVDSPNITIQFGDAVTSIALLTAAYLIGKLVINRCREIIAIIAAAEHSAYEAEKAKNNAEAAAEARTRFLANMSHEIRTPLNGILGLAENALDDTALTENQRDYWNKLRNSADSLAAVVSDILDLSKIDAGEFSLENVPFSLHDVLTECTTIMAANAEAKGLNMILRDKTALDRMIIGDSTRLRQALLNLLSNAVKFTRNGSVTITAECVGVSEDSTVAVRFEVTDTGIGITKEQCSVIFEPFKQADDSTTRNFGGTGLGLAITKSIVEMMGGEIVIESVPNMGSKFLFTVSFILSDEKCEHNKVGSTSGADYPALIGEVLVCEDNELNRLVAAKSLEKIGLRYTMTDNGKSAIDEVIIREREGRPFDVILMDIHMPVMDGLEAAKVLIGAGVKTPIIAMTANVMTRDRDKYLAAGMADYIGKPFKIRELSTCLSKYLPSNKSKAITDSGQGAATSNAVIDRMLGIENSADDEALFEKNLAIYLEKRRGIYLQLEEALANKDFILAHRIAHTEKGAAKLIGAVRLAQILAELEHAFKDGYYQDGMLDDYSKELNRVLEYISGTQ